MRQQWFRRQGRKAYHLGTSRTGEECKLQRARVRTELEAGTILDEEDEEVEELVLVMPVACIRESRTKNATE